MLLFSLFQALHGHRCIWMSGGKCQQDWISSSRCTLCYDFYSSIRTIRRVNISDHCFTPQSATTLLQLSFAQNVNSVTFTCPNEGRVHCRANFNGKDDGPGYSLRRACTSFFFSLIFMLTMTSCVFVSYRALITARKFAHSSTGRSGFDGLAIYIICSCSGFLVYEGFDCHLCPSYMCVFLEITIATRTVLGPNDR